MWASQGQGPYPTYPQIPVTRTVSPGTKQVSAGLFGVPSEWGPHSHPLTPDAVMLKWSNAALPGTPTQATAAGWFEERSSCRLYCGHLCLCVTHLWRGSQPPSDSGLPPSVSSCVEAYSLITVELIQKLIMERSWGNHQWTENKIAHFSRTQRSERKSKGELKCILKGTEVKNNISKVERAH